MSQELQLGKYEFYPNDRLQQLIEQLLHELRRLRRSGRSKPEYTEDGLDRMYKEMADYEAANPDCFEWVDD
jgi:hypothetical protein